MLGFQGNLLYARLRHIVGHPHSRVGSGNRRILEEVRFITIVLIFIPRAELYPTTNL